MIFHPMMNDDKPNKATDNTQKAKRPKRLKLPFDGRRKDPVIWAYDNRRGLCVMLIIYLVLAILFVSSKIAIHNSSQHQTFIVDLKTLEQLEQQKQQLEQQVRQRQQLQPEDYSSVSNRVSNENAKMDDRLRDDRSTDVEELVSGAEAAQEKMRANRRRYEQGLGEEQAMRTSKSKSDNTPTQSDSKAKGRVTVSFSFKNPIRYSQHLVVPAYRCESGGEVVLDVTLNRNGNVTSATVNRSASNCDNCMEQTALDAAKNSRFNIDTSAPDKHTGTITYIFIPQ